MSTLNLIVQSLHSIARWGVVILGVLAIIRGLMGWLGKKPFTSTDNKVGMLYTIALDVQILLGLILYFSKGWFGVLTADFGAAMSTGATRFFSIEHLLLMIVAVAVAHMGRSLSRKASTDSKKHSRAALLYLLSFIILLAGIPWPFLESGRPWLRLFGISF